MKDQSINAIIVFIHFPLYSFFLFKCCISLHWIFYDTDFDLGDVALNVKLNMRLMVVMKKSLIEHYYYICSAIAQQMNFNGLN